MVFCKQGIEILIKEISLAHLKLLYIAKEKTNRIYRVKDEMLVSRQLTFLIVSFVTRRICQIWGEYVVSIYVIFPRYAPPPDTHNYTTTLKSIEVSWVKVFRDFPGFWRMSFVHGRSDRCTYTDYMYLWRRRRLREVRVGYCISIYHLYTTQLYNTRARMSLCTWMCAAQNPKEHWPPPLCMGTVYQVCSAISYLHGAYAYRGIPRPRKRQCTHGATLHYNNIVV